MPSSEPPEPSGEPVRSAVSVERMRALLDNSWDILSLLDGEGRLIYNSPAAQRLHGFSPEEMAGRNTFDFFHPEDTGRVAELFQHCLAAPGVPVRAEYRYARKDGSWLWMEAVAVNLLQDPAVQAIVVNSRDITDRLNQQRALQDSERFADQVLDTLTANLAVLDNQGRILRVNRAWRAFATANGLPSDQRWEGVSYLAVCDQASGLDLESAQAMAGGIRAVLAGELPEFHLEYPCHSPQQERWFQAQVSRFQGHGDAKVVVAHLDITHLREAESRRLELERLLQHSQKMESLGSLAGGVAHDMNNVLASILGIASLQEELVPTGTPVHDAFAIIAKACLRGGGLVRRLLDFARRDLSEIREVDLNILIQEETQLLERTTLGRVQLVADLDPQLQAIRGDAGALVHAVMNLCLNAVDAMPDGGLLTLRTRNLPDHHVELVVADTGPGMSEDVRRRAFDPFFTTKPVGKGTGLGLSIVYSTVQAHHGTLHLVSEPGQGTQVVLRFPAAEAALGTPGAAAPASQALVPSTPMTLFLVDDDPLIRDALPPMVQALGHRVKVFTGGEAALDALETGPPPQAILLDLNMPGLAGAGTLAHIRSQHPALPVILVSGRMDQAALDLAQCYQAVSLLAKPFRMEDLRERLTWVATRLL